MLQAAFPCCVIMKGCWAGHGRTALAMYVQTGQQSVGHGLTLLSAVAGVKGGNPRSGVCSVPHSGPGQRIPGRQQGRSLQPAHHRLLLRAPLPGMSPNLTPLSQLRVP